MPPLIFQNDDPSGPNWMRSFLADRFVQSNASDHRATMSKDAQSIEVCVWMRLDLGHNHWCLSLQNPSHPSVREHAELICVAAGWRPVEGSPWLLTAPLPGDVGDAYMISGDCDEIDGLLESLRSNTKVELNERTCQTKKQSKRTHSLRKDQHANWNVDIEDGYAVQENVSIRWLFLQLRDVRRPEAILAFDSCLDDCVAARRLKFVMKRSLFCER